MTPYGKTHRLLLGCFLKTNNSTFILGQNLAAKWQKIYIKLIIYGENEAEYGNPHTNNESKLDLIFTGP